jgi:23S rRNA pseudouridine1911/1915/1917 synthase
MKTKWDFPRAKEGKRDRLEFAVGDRHPGKPKRLDKYLQERFPGYSRSFLQKMIKDEKVLINGKTTKSSWHVTYGETITMLLHPAGARVAEDIAFEVLYQDEAIMAVSKPAGVIVHPARGHLTGTLFNGLLHYFREELAADPSFHIGTVHRLDEWTSGLIVYALCLKAHGELTRQFENRLVKKTYVCLVHGDAAFEDTVISEPLGTHRTDRFKVACNGLDAKPAETRYVKLARSTCGRFSMLRAFPHTGRTHQIRVHAAALGLPLIGDVIYGGLKEHEAFKGIAARCCLHAESLSLTHPVSEQPMVLGAPLPADFLQLMEVLGFQADGPAKSE